MPPGWRVKRPKDDDEYFERMTKSIFTAGLNWNMIDKKWPNFQEAFSGFSRDKVSRFSEKDVQTLMKEQRIVRNERKIRATISNAYQFFQLQSEFGSFRKYLDSYGKDEELLQADVQKRFLHLGPSTARTFLWSVGYQLTPNPEEKEWMAGHE